MPSTDLQRLFYRTANSLVSPREDFLSEVLRIAILHDRRPLLRMLSDMPAERWKVESRRPELDLALDSPTQVVDVDTQYQLEQSDDREAGRLDIRAALEGGSSMRQEIWIEVKVDASLNQRNDGRTQLDVYLDHRAAADAPAPVLVTLAREPSLDGRVTGFSWKELATAVTRVPEADRWWHDLVDFLRADGIVPSPLSDDARDPAEYMSVYKTANACLKELGGGAPMTLHWLAIEKAVIGGLGGSPRVR